MNVWWNLPVKPSGPGLLFVGRFFITDSIFLLVISLSRFSILHGSIWFSCMFLRIYQFPLGHSIFWHIIVHSRLLWSFVFLWYHLLYLLFNSWLHLFEFLFFLVTLAKSFSTLCIFSKNHLLPSLVFSIVFLVFILFISALILGCVYSSFSCFWRLFETFLIS